MTKNKDILSDPTTIIKEVENQLEKIFNKKKQEIEKELEGKIQQEKEEAKKKIEQIERELEDEKKALVNYRTTLAEFENNKADMKNQIKEHINKALQFLAEIDTLTGQTLEEIKKVSELNHKLEEFHHAAEEKTAILRKDLEEKFGIVAEGLETRELENADLKHELTKLKKIKELLSSAETPEPEAKITIEKRKAEEDIEESEVSKEDELHVKKPKTNEAAESTLSEENEAKDKEPSAKGESEKSILKGDTDFQEAFETLAKFRKSERAKNDGEVSYFQNKDKMILDGESFVSNLNRDLDEAKKLFTKLTQAESPKDQFFIKQEILRFQKSLRKIILGSVRLCEKETCSLPKFTLDILNMDVLKDILEKVSMENWSDQNEFHSFNEFAKKIKNAYYERITPWAAYLKSVIEELGIE
ncbi:MAG: hypothetical protein GTN73_07225 [Candidatus Aminicenantes bacterium]|nr:hypothetical protein [Candidatus Aminicenantes bacterium]